MGEYIERGRPYDTIGKIIDEWCQKNYYTEMLVTISIGYEWETPHEETQLMLWDNELCSLVWEMDWWEGQQHAELVGFAPTHKIRLVGEDAEVQPVKHGRWSDPAEDMCVCTSCGWGFLLPYKTRAEDAKLVHGFNYCPNCGAKMDKEVDNG